MAGLLKARKTSSFVGLGALGLLAAFAFVACSSDGGGSTSNEQTGGTDGQGNEAGSSSEGFDCAGVDDGEPCGEASLCMDGECVPSRCGDGVVDEALDEQCEDGNDETGDGCSLCRFDCDADAVCDDGQACNGEETCDTKAHRCEPGTEAADQTACMMSDEGEGACRGGACVPPGCGDGAVGEGEVCDDGNEEDGDGCTSACEYTCTTDEQCDNGNKCDGAETCDVETNTCLAGEAVTCAAESCAGECSPELGECVFPDGDGDGVSCEADCADDDADRHPGAYECQDQKDNDCNADTDDKTSSTCECYVDGDRDGFSSTLTGSIVTKESCPDKYTRTRPYGEAAIDCAPRVAAAYPGQKEFFPTAYCPGILACKVGDGVFDYNCDGEETSSLADNKVAANSCAGANGIVFCQLRSGWVTKIPACGDEGIYRACNWANDACTGTDVPNRVRPCH